MSSVDRRESCGYDARRIAWNTAWLYVRLAVVTVADVLAVRVVMTALGVEDFGVFSAVAAVVTSLLFLNGTLQSTIQRFLSRAFGSGGRSDDVSAEFAVDLGLTAILCAGIACLGETAGLHYVVRCLDLADDRLPAAVSVLHIGVMVMVLRTLVVPFQALIISSEQMNAFAAISVIEAVLSLGSAFGMRFVPDCRIEAYAGLLLVAALVVLALYVVTCLRRHPSLRLVPTFRPSRLGESGAFFSWTVLSSLANALKYQGVAMLVGAYAGIAYSATWNISMKIGTSLYAIIGNFQQAYFPQIMKLWMAKDKRPFVLLLTLAQRWSALLMGVFCLPLAIAPGPILAFWIGGELPPQSVAFTRCVAIHFFIDALTGPLNTAALARGRLSDYMPFNALTMGSGFVLAWACLASGLPPWTSVASVLVSNVLSLAYRLWYVRVRMGIRITFRDAFAARRRG